MCAAISVTKGSSMQPKWSPSTLTTLKLAEADRSPERQRPVLHAGGERVRIAEPGPAESRLRVHVTGRNAKARLISRFGEQ
jgi:hypothetical protein